MKKSESLTNNFLIELDYLTSRLKNINLTFSRTENKKLRERLIYENYNISERIREIKSIANLLDTKKNESFSFSKLLLEKCKRSIEETKIGKKLFL